MINGNFTYLYLSHPVDLQLTFQTSYRLRSAGKLNAGSQICKQLVTCLPETKLPTAGSCPTVLYVRKSKLSVDSLDLEIFSMYFTKTGLFFCYGLFSCLVHLIVSSLGHT